MVCFGIFVPSLLSTSVSWSQFGGKSCQLQVSALAPMRGLHVVVHRTVSFTQPKFSASKPWDLPACVVFAVAYSVDIEPNVMNLFLPGSALLGSTCWWQSPDGVDTAAP